MMCFHNINKENVIKRCIIIFTPQPLGAVGVLFSPMVSGWAFRHLGRQVGGKVCLACISETVTCRKLILSRDIG